MNMSCVLRQSNTMNGENEYVVYRDFLNFPGHLQIVNTGMLAFNALARECERLRAQFNNANLIRAERRANARLRYWFILWQIIRYYGEACVACCVVHRLRCVVYAFKTSHSVCLSIAGAVMNIPCNARA